jgi:1,4-dihydroxy-6-naphthoate synthase
VDPRGYEFEPVIEDIQTLNEWALEGRLEVTAMSLATFPHVAARYVLLPHGASMGSGYGPVVVAPKLLSFDDLRVTEIAVPGELTTAYMVLRMVLGGDFPHVVLPFDQILPAVSRGEVAAGLLIHEGQLTYRDTGLVKCVDLGEWWLLETGLPLPLGVNTIRRDLGDQAMRDVSEILRASIDASLAHRELALQYALGFGRGMDAERGDKFIGMYVNELTSDYGDEGREAVRELLQRSGNVSEVQFVE